MTGTNATRSGTPEERPAPLTDGLRIIGIDAIDRDAVVDAIARLERELFGRGAWSANMVREELDAPARTYYACIDRNGDDGDDIVGYAGFWYDGDDAELMTIGVAESHRRRGIAAHLLATLVDEAKRQGAARMLLEVRVDNDPALALYERFGFARLGLRKRYYQPEGIDAYTMALDLEPRVVGFRSPSETDETDASGQQELQERNERKEDNR
ncbi:ribosomal protein S18-alanine N-acetyltransferase [Bifidobacterium sp. MA2]|uniref:Ribosomal protein S18-alanine N-acetyltransferase n=1 Tax=Bifidobacterium santillanense TaxID=2809028 RepID=A0ABS5ULM1_9BIFI|nr:ribosomal protein S18-alanine N-acetyltransferase [Bifidobacterium santillanense]MBT1171811.1 ribosomal protein S18-alanine N-acetyltransferase [Bifidobacterium santillanense]